MLIGTTLMQATGIDQGAAAGTHGAQHLTTVADSVEVELEGGDLVIRGESRREREVRDEDYYRAERSFGSFHRRLPLPFDVDPDRIQASLADGVLEVRIPKPAETRIEAKRIQVT